MPKVQIAPNRSKIQWFTKAITSDITMLDIYGSNFDSESYSKLTSWSYLLLWTGLERMRKASCSNIFLSSSSARRSCYNHPFFLRHRCCGQISQCLSLIDRILQSIMCIQVQCAPEFHNDFCQKKIFFKNNFTRINHCRFIPHKSHLKPFLSYLLRYSLKGIFQHHFQCKKVHTILDGNLCR